MAKDLGVVHFTFQKHGTVEGFSANETRESTDKVQTPQKNTKEAVDESLGDMEGTVSTSMNRTRIKNVRCETAEALSCFC